MGSVPAQHDPPVEGQRSGCLTLTFLTRAVIGNMLFSSQKARLVWYRERVGGEWVSTNRGDSVGCPEGGGSGSELGEGEKDQISLGE